jgi:hypothetical protein
LAKTVVITQSNYLPWRGYFELLRSADEVVLLDSVQYTRRDWRNRNRIKTSQGIQWLTIPVKVKGRYSQPIDQTRIVDSRWCANHIRGIETAYRNAAHYQDVAPWLFLLLESVADEPLLARVNERTIRAICERLAIATTIRRCTDLVAREKLSAMGATERLVTIANALGADSYLTGLAARDYLDVDLFRAAGIEVQWMSYEGHAPYPQLWGSFEPRVSIVDLLLNTGREAIRYLGKAVK